MIAQRFRPVAWVAGVATAATMLYMISAQVAAERSRLEAVDQQIADTKDEIRQLQTEMGARASLRQLERWNGEVLALSSPSARQYVDGEEGISSISSANLGPDGVAPPPVMASVLSKPAAPVAIDGQVASTETPKVLSAQDQMVQKAVAAPSVANAAPKQVAIAKPKPTTPAKVASAAPVTVKERKLADIVKSIKPEAESNSRKSGGKE